MGEPEVEPFGPVPAPMERRAGRHRAQLLPQRMSRVSLHCLLTPQLQSLEQLPGGRQVHWSLDTSPIDLFWAPPQKTPRLTGISRNPRCPTQTAG